MSKVQYSKRDKILKTMRIKTLLQRIPIHIKIFKQFMEKNLIKTNKNRKLRYNSQGTKLIGNLAQLIQLRS